MSADRKFVPPQLLDDIEDVEAYRAGGFHPVSIGDYFAQGRYRILHKLGYGGSSTVWLARDQGGTQSGRLVTLKVVRADASDIRNPALTIPGILQAANPSCSGIQTVDHHFFVKGPNGSHLVLASQFAGPSILAMSDCPGRVFGSKRLRADLARKVAKQVATALHYMHSAGVVHGDTDVYANLEEPQTEEVRTLGGLPCPPCAPRELVAPVDNNKITDPSFLEESVILADFGQSFVATSRPPNYEPATHPNYLPPEVRFEGRTSFEADVWALGCAIFEIRAGFPLFSSFFGSDSDILRQTVETLGRLPDPWWRQFERRASWFEDNGEPKSIQDQESAGVTLHASKSSLREQLRSIGTQDDAPWYNEGAMIEKPGVRLCEKEVCLLGDLLEKMLKYRPEDRIGMQEVIMHPWLETSD
ncbi:hypothetical protein EIP86_011341 [Pleurotus ostreatoroseus]|nr:hypothetical protein EIP86_011341 [Pleurotus ostreatoroseus]